MGIILSRFRKKKSAEKQLEDIEKEINEIENNKQYAVQREKYIVWRLFIYSSIIYITSAVLFYVYFFPASLRDQIFYMIPLLIFPVIIFFVKKGITWVYSRKITKDKDKLLNLRKRKKEILDDVMNTETYKVAKQILDKYAPEQVRKPPPAPLHQVAQNIGGQSPITPLNKPMMGMGNVVLVTARGRAIVPQSNAQMGPNSTPIMGPRQFSPPRPRLIRPVFPSERTYLDRLIDALIGDGPSNRYALICKNCSSHNGMALKEEFEYLAFRCVYCGFPNPSVKIRPRSQLSLPPYSPSSPNSKTGDKEENRTDGSDDQQSGVIIEEVEDTDKSEVFNADKTEEVEDNNRTTDGLTKRNVIETTNEEIEGNSEDDRQEEEKVTSAAEITEINGNHDNEETKKTQ
ncbi:hypothetical protein O3M35_010039 [Rhynocoris fuscipes]|uniref:Endoplasmic reticulum junction formation protein lunapark n=1 Tax=Rhynocoris fuscipes TaxID=488301 RepID=A0AAW1CXU9_9HEMI